MQAFLYDRGSNRENDSTHVLRPSPGVTSGTSFVLCIVCVCACFCNHCVCIFVQASCRWRRHSPPMPETRVVQGVTRKPKKTMSVVKDATYRPSRKPAIVDKSLPYPTRNGNMPLAREVSAEARDDPRSQSANHTWLIVTENIPARSVRMWLTRETQT